MTARPRGQGESEALESNQALLDISEPCPHGHRPPTQSSGGRIRTCASRLTVVRLAARPHRNGRRGSRTPKARRPTRFRDGTPHRWQSFRSGPGRIRTCTAPIKSRQLWPVELRSRGCGRQGSNLLRAAFQTAALPVELQPHDGIVAIVAATDMRGRGSQRLAVSRRTDRSRHGFGAVEAGLRSGVGEAGIEPATSCL